MNKYALYTDNADQVYPVIEKDGKFYITSKGSKTFSGNWELIGFCETSKGARPVIKPADALNITDWKFKNGSPRYSVVDRDHGTVRVWGTTKLSSFGTISDNMFQVVTNSNNDDEIVLEEEASQASATGTGINGKIDSFPIIPKKIEEEVSQDELTWEYNEEEKLYHCEIYNWYFNIYELEDGTYNLIVDYRDEELQDLDDIFNSLEDAKARALKIYNKDLLDMSDDDYAGFEYNVNESTNILHELALLEDYEEELNNSFKVKSYRDEDTGGHTMVTFGQFENGKYFAVSDLTVSVFDADYWEAFTSNEEGDMEDWYEDHLIANFNDLDPQYNEICSQLKGTVNYVALDNKSIFIDYCSDKIVDMDEDIVIEGKMYTTIMHSDEIRNFKDVRVIFNYDDEDDSFIVIDNDNNILIDTLMIDCNQYAASMEFDKIDSRYYNMLMDYWEDFNMDAYFK